VGKEKVEEEEEEGGREGEAGVGLRVGENGRRGGGGGWGVVFI